jgi:hypothetical protein
VVVRFGFRMVTGHCGEVGLERSLERKDHCYILEEVLLVRQGQGLASVRDRACLFRFHSSQVVVVLRLACLLVDHSLPLVVDRILLLAGLLFHVRTFGDLPYSVVGPCVVVDFASCSHQLVKMEWGCRIDPLAAVHDLKGLGTDFCPNLLFRYCW